ncbi:MAG: DUF4097 domain-containing protein [Roseivirga sp.]|nr:DUF4097 domain-containing protein [Roseivirga sp.]
MKIFKTTLILLALCLVTTVYGQKTINKTFDGVESIRINIASGNGIIKKGTSKQVKVTLEYTYDDNDYEPSFDQNGTTLRIKEEFDRGRRNWNVRGKSEWTLEIPDGLRVDMNTGSGNIEITGLNIELDASSGSGNVEVDNITGDTRLSTGSGNIEARNMNGELRANTGSGTIRVSDAKGDADLNTGSGNIRASRLEGGLELSTGSGNVDAVGVIITDHSRFSTGSGNVDVELGGELNSDLQLTTGSGNATLDFNGVKIEGQFTMEASSKGSISAPFDFDREYDEDNGYSRRGRNKRYVKEAKIGNKDIRIDISSGSGSARVRR